MKFLNSGTGREKSPVWSSRANRFFYWASNFISSFLHWSKKSLSKAKVLANKIVGVNCLKDELEDKDFSSPVG